MYQIITRQNGYSLVAVLFLFVHVFAELPLAQCCYTFDSPLAGGFVMSDCAAASVDKSSSMYLSIISQQTFIGCWQLNTELSNLLGLSLKQLKDSAPVKVNSVYHLMKSLKLFVKN